MSPQYFTDTKEIYDVTTTDVGISSNSKADLKKGEVIELDLESLSRQTSIPPRDKDNNAEGELQAGLTARHIQLIALGGAVGTGLFVGTSGTLNTCGPAGLFVSYCIISLVLYPIMSAFGEMVCFYPGDGKDAAGSMSYIVGRYVDPSLSFAVGWNYYYCFAILVATECTAASGVVQYWTEAVPVGAWITIFILVIFGLNMCAVKYYGESEFWFANLKIICIIGLIILCFILFWGGGPHHDRLGFRYWKHPGAFAHHITGGSFGSFLDIYTGIIKGAFAFILGPELICLTSSESQDQRKNIEKASRRFVWRLIFFYVLSALAISVTVAYNDPTLKDALSQSKPGAGSSPFVIGIQNAGIHVLPHIINACILISAWSAGNAFMFAASRSLLTLARNGQAPRVFARVNRFGVPYVGVTLTFLISCLAYLNVSSSSSNVFTWLSNISTISGFIGWICGLVAYLRYRAAITYNDMWNRVPFKTWGQPWMAIWSLLIVSIITLTNGYETLIPRYWKASDFVAAYITLPIFLVLWFGHKLWSRSWKHWWYPVQEIDITSGIQEMEEKTQILDEERILPQTWWAKILDKLC